MLGKIKPMKRLGIYSHRPAPPRRRRSAFGSGGAVRAFDFAAGRRLPIPMAGAENSGSPSCIDSSTRVARTSWIPPTPGIPG